MSPKNAYKKKSLELVALALTFLVSFGLLFYVLFSFSCEQTTAAEGDVQTVDYSFAQEIIKLPFTEALAFCLAPDGTFWIAVKGKLHHVNKHGKSLNEMKHPGTVTALELSDNVLYSATADSVFKLDLKQNNTQNVPFIKLKQGSLITSLAISGERLFLADCAHKMVLAYDFAGKELWQSKGNGGFVIPSPYFCLCADGDDGIWVTNPGHRRLERYDKDGRYLSMWEPNKSVKFIGCCNPAKMKILPDGTVVTLEKGMVRSRLFSPAGNVTKILVKPGTLISKDFTYDFAANDNGQVYILVKHANLILRVR